MMQASMEECKEDVPLVRSDWWTGEMTGILKLNVVPIPCDACELGKMRSSATSCSCVNVPTDTPVGSSLFEAHKVAQGTTLRVMMNINGANQVTLRQWAGAEGKFVYNLDTSTVQLECLESVGEPFGNEYYQQVTLKAITPNCRWSYRLESEDKTQWIVAEFIVAPEKQPTAQGELVLLDQLDFTQEVKFDFAAETFITVRGVETATGFGWEEPTQAFKCLKLVDKNFEGFNTGYFQWLFQAKNSDVDCTEDITLTRTDEEKTTVTFNVNVQRGFCPAVECPATQLVNLDVTSCACEDLKQTYGIVHDSRSFDDRIVRLDQGEKFTIREWATTTGEFEFSAIDST
jgi:hypothetical protein